MVLQELAQLVLLARGHHVEDRFAPVLVELAQQVGRVIRRHPLQKARRLLIGLRLEELDLVFRVELLEHVRREGQVALDRLDDLLALCV